MASRSLGFGSVRHVLPPTIEIDEALVKARHEEEGLKGVGMLIVRPSVVVWSFGVNYRYRSEDGMELRADVNKRVQKDGETQVLKTERDRGMLDES